VCRVVRSAFRRAVPKQNTCGLSALSVPLGNSSFKSKIQSEVLIGLQSDKALLHGEVLSDQLTRWYCIDRLSPHDESGVRATKVEIISVLPSRFTC
jgi:hypothetical protein